MAEEPEILSLESFQKHVGTVFTVVVGEAEVELKLQEIKDQSHLAGVGPDGNPIGIRSPFTLTFSGPKEVPLPQATYTLTHPAMGELALFMKPFHESPEAYYYEVIFN